MKNAKYFEFETEAGSYCVSLNELPSDSSRYKEVQYFVEQQVDQLVFTADLPENVKVRYYAQALDHDAIVMMLESFCIGYQKIILDASPAANLQHPQS